MAKPYSYDFRQRVIQAIEMDGLKKIEASEPFNISRNTARVCGGSFPRKTALLTCG